MLVSETNNNYPLGNYPKTENPTNATQKQGILPQTENSSPDSVQQKTFLEKAKECTKEAAISMIPVYGTIQEFKKGNYGWGIFGIISDIALLVPLVGYGAKAAAGLIRGCSVAARVGEVGVVTAVRAGEAGVVTATKAGEAGVVTATRVGIKTNETALRGGDSLLQMKNSLFNITEASANAHAAEKFPVISFKNKSVNITNTQPNLLRKINKNPKPSGEVLNYFNDFKPLEHNDIYRHQIDLNRAFQFITKGKNPPVKDTFKELNKIVAKDGNAIASSSRESRASSFLLLDHNTPTTSGISDLYSMHM
ncbi:hypothetical protein V9J15_01325 [Candidatus Liberibacter africanus]|uniref:hypothetical protein n=1 Tax=Liberibacter africanus TaxID=34020 RepID=UPI00339D85C8